MNRDIPGSMAGFAEDNPWPVLRVSDQGLLLYANKAAQPLLPELGCGPDIPLAAPYAKVLQEALAARESREAELEIQGLRFRLVFSPLDKEPAANIFGQEITPGQDALARLKQETALNQALYMAAPVGVALMEEGLFSFANEAFCRMTGYSQRELAGKSPAMLHVTREEYETARKVHLAIIAENSTGGMEVRWQTKDKGIRTISLRSTPVPPTGGPERLVLTALDISERRVQEARLRRGEAGLKQSQRLTGLGSWELNPASKAMSWSEELFRLLGYSPGSLEPSLELFWRHVHPNDRDRSKAQLDTACEQSTGFSAEIRFLTMENEERYGLMRCETETDEYGGAGYIVGTLHDITGQKRIEEELRSAIRSAKSADHAKTEFLNNISHELRTPLNGVLGMFQLLNSSNLDEMQRQYVEIGQRAGKGLLTLINDLLNFSLIELGMIEIQESPFEPAELLQSVMRTFEARAAAKTIQLSHNVTPDVPETLIGDEGRLRQVLFNLVANAFRFTRQGFIRAEASMLPIRPVDGQARLLVMVADSGYGIPYEKQAAIFEPFTQAEPSLIRRHGGMGLGLSIVRRLVDKLGGTMSVESEPGQGTSFYFTLPVGVPDQDQKERPSPTKRPRPHKGRKILLVEDDPINRITIEELLHILGYSALSVENGEQALDVLARKRFDCVLMDIQMPAMDGVEATKAIRSNNNLGDMRFVPIIAVTAYAMPGDREKYLAAGMNNYLPKPVELRDLADILQSTLSA